MEYKPPSSIRRRGRGYLTCQLGIKYGTPSLIPLSLATKMWQTSWAPRTSNVTRAPGRPSFNSSRLSKVNLKNDRKNLVITKARFRLLLHECDPQEKKMKKKQTNEKHNHAISRIKGIPCPKLKSNCL